MKAIRFEQEKVTKNTVRFTEVADGMDTAAIGTLYVQKHVLKELGYQEGQQIIITLEVENACN